MVTYSRCGDRRVWRSLRIGLRDYPGNAEYLVRDLVGAPGGSGIGNALTTVRDRRDYALAYTTTRGSRGFIAWSSARFDVSVRRATSWG